MYIIWLEGFLAKSEFATKLSCLEYVAIFYMPIWRKGTFKICCTFNSSFLILVVLLTSIYLFGIKILFIKAKRKVKVYKIIMAEQNRHSIQIHL